MPNPAESLRNMNELAEVISERTSGFEITGTMLGPPDGGGCGGDTGEVVPPLPPRRFIAIMVLFSPDHAPPGCHPQPAPGQNDHDP
jgi:hypothetical protein